MKASGVIIIILIVILAILSGLMAFSVNCKETECETCETCETCDTCPGVECDLCICPTSIETSAICESYTDAGIVVCPDSTDSVLSEEAGGYQDWMLELIEMTCPALTLEDLSTTLMFNMLADDTDTTFSLTDASYEDLLQYIHPDLQNCLSDKPFHRDNLLSVYKMYLNNRKEFLQLFYQNDIDNCTLVSDLFVSLYESPCFSD